MYGGQTTVIVDSLYIYLLFILFVKSKINSHEVFYALKLKQIWLEIKNPEKSIQLEQHWFLL